MNRRYTMRLLLAALATLTAHAQPQAEGTMLYTAVDRLFIHDSASRTASVVDTLYRGDSVLLLGSEGIFYRVRFQGAEGYVLWSKLKDRPVRKRAAGRSRAQQKAGRKQKDAAAPAVSDSGPTAASSGKKADGEPQCAGHTLGGTRCSRATVDPSGFCWQHRK